VRHDLARGHQPLDLKIGGVWAMRRVIFGQDVLAQIDTEVADEHTIRASDQAFYLIM
jgi:hypothetical protein